MSQVLKDFTDQKRDEKMYKKVPIFRCTTPSTGKRLGEVVVGTLVSQVFVSTDARRACPRSVTRSTAGAYPSGSGSNPVEGNGHFFPSYRQLYLSSFRKTDALRPTQLRSLQTHDVAVPQIGVGVFHA